MRRNAHFYYTNQQSARLMFYHDHAWGITRLNVYAGEAAGYLIGDDTEKALVHSGTIPGPTDTVPLGGQGQLLVSPRVHAGQGASIREDNEVGDDVSIGTNAVLEFGNRIGRRARIACAARATRTARAAPWCCACCASAPTA